MRRRIINDLLFIFSAVIFLVGLSKMFEMMGEGFSNLYFAVWHLIAMPSISILMILYSICEIIIGFGLGAFLIILCLYGIFNPLFSKQLVGDNKLPFGRK